MGNLSKCTIYTENENVGVGENIKQWELDRRKFILKALKSIFWGIKF